MSIEKEEILSVHEQNWVISLYCNIPYYDVRKIDDPGEREFLIQTAAFMKRKQEKFAKIAEEREAQLQEQFQQGMFAAQAGSNPS